MPNPNRRASRRSRVNDVIDAYHRVGESTDPLGMYTGVPNEARMLIDPADPTATRYRSLTPKEKEAAKPVQDVDDL